MKISTPASLIPALLALLLASTPLAAKDMDGEFAVFGSGATRCENYLQARSAGGAAQRRYADWTLAYVSAFNLIVPNTYDLMGNFTLDQALDWLDQHCRKQRREIFVNAVAALSEQLYTRRANIAPGKDTRAKWAKEVISGSE